MCVFLCGVVVCVLCVCLVLVMSVLIIFCWLMACDFIFIVICFHSVFRSLYRLNSSGGGAFDRDAVRLGLLAACLWRCWYIWSCVRLVV